MTAAAMAPMATVRRIRVRHGRGARTRATITTIGRKSTSSARLRAARPAARANQTPLRRDGARQNRRPTSELRNAKNRAAVSDSTRPSLIQMLA